MMVCGTGASVHRALIVKAPEPHVKQGGSVTVRLDDSTMARVSRALAVATGCGQPGPTTRPSPPPRAHIRPRPPFVARAEVQ